MKYRLTRTATVVQFKDVEAPEGTHKDDIVDASWNIPWQEAKVIDSDGVAVEPYEP